MVAYRINSLLRLCSRTSPGRDVKRASSAATRMMRSSILSMTGMVSCEWVRQKRTTGRGSQANLVISVSSGDGSQDSFKRTKSVHDLSGNSRAPERRVFASSILNWWGSITLECEQVTNTHSGVSPNEHVHPRQHGHCQTRFQEVPSVVLR